MTELFISLKNDGKLNVVAMFTTHFLSSVLGGSFPRVPMSTFQRDRSDEGRKSVPRVKNKKYINCIFVQQMLHYPRTVDYKESVVEDETKLVTEVDVWYSIYFVCIIVERSGTTLRYDAICLSDSEPCVHVSAAAHRTDTPAQRLLPTSIVIWTF